MVRNVVVLLLLISFTGCAATGDYRDTYQQYIEARTKDINPNRGKIVEFTAKEGEAIKLEGVASFIVYGNDGGRDNTIAPPEQPKSEWVGTVNALIGAASSFGTTAILGSVVKGIVKATAENAGHNTNSVSTATNTSTTSNANQSNTDSHNSADQQNTSTVSTATTTSTTSTDSHNTTSTADSHNTTSTHTNTPTTTATGGAAGITYTGGAVTN